MFLEVPVPNQEGEWESGHVYKCLGPRFYLSFFGFPISFWNDVCFFHVIFIDIFLLVGNLVNKAVFYELF